MRIVFISDSHGQHKAIDLPGGDMLIHAGDFSGRGLEWQVKRFMEWLEKQPHKHKVIIAGNHDFLAERDPEAFEALVPDNVHYLNDSGIELEGLKIWGSPITPWFYDWAFNRERGEEIREYWELIPEDTDILITHGPPFGILDETDRGEKVGCADLLDKVEAIRPKIHVFGHIHEAYGEEKIGGTHFINASVLNLQYELVNEPIVVEI